MSVTALREELDPRNWFLRPHEGNDYGTDGEVEIADKDGYLTGRTFRIQIKSTDKSVPHQLSIKQTTFNYWAQLSLPVLVALYSTVNDKFYGYWAHSLAPDPSTQQIILNFSGTDEIDFGTIGTEVAMLRTLRERAVDVPMGLTYTSYARGSEVTRLQLAQVLYVSNGFLAYAEDANDSGQSQTDTVRAPFRVERNEDALVVELAPHLASVSWRTNDPSTSPEWLVQTVVMSVAMILGRLGWDGPAVMLLNQIDTSHPAYLSDDVRHKVILICMTALDPTPALRIAEALQDAEDPAIRDIGASYYAVVVLGRLDADLAYQVQVLSAFVAAEERAELPHRAAKPCYSIGNLLRSNGFFKEAILAYKRALALDPEYEKRPYISLEIGGCYFLLGNYVEAMKWYSRGHELEKTVGDVPSDTLARFADSLLHAGQYDEARQVLSQMSTSDPLPPEVQRVLSCVHCIQNHVGDLGRQKRRRAPRGGRVDARGVLKGYDALDASAWRMLAKELADPDVWVAIGHLENTPETWAESILALCGLGWKHWPDLLEEQLKLHRGLLMAAFVAIEVPMEMTDVLVDLIRNADLSEPVTLRFYPSQTD